MSSRLNSGLSQLPRLKRLRIPGVKLDKCGRFYRFFGLSGQISSKQQAAFAEGD
jgi:hypothetical protein